MTMLLRCIRAENRKLRRSPIWLLSLTATFGVLFAVMAWKALKHKEV